MFPLCKSLVPLVHSRLSTGTHLFPSIESHGLGGKPLLSSSFQLLINSSWSLCCSCVTVYLEGVARMGIVRGSFSHSSRKWSFTDPSPACLQSIYRVTQHWIATGSLRQGHDPHQDKGWSRLGLSRWCGKGHPKAQTSWKTQTPNNPKLCGCRVRRLLCYCIFEWHECVLRPSQERALRTRSRRLWVGKKSTSGHSF